MVYRVLGVIALALGGVFGIITLLVTVTFVDNLNTSLLVLAGVFGVLAYVFLAIGWQLFHPPSDTGSRVESPANVVGAGVSAPTASTAGPTAEAGAVGAAAIEESESESAAADSLAAADASEDAGRPDGSSSNGAGSAAVSLPTGAGFKKPGSPVPHK